MKTSRQNHLKVPIIAFFMCVMQVNGASLTITQHPLYPNVSTSASLTCHIPSFTSIAEWFNNGVSLTTCLSSLCIPPSSTRYQYSANVTTTTVTIPSVDIALDDNTWKCAHNLETDTGYFNFTVYELPSTLYIDGINSSILYEGDTVNLSVSTGCIHPSGSAYYTVIWKYVEATSAAENNFGTIITQNVTSVGGCQNTYEDNLMFNLFLTNDMNTGNTSISISQVKMTFTMAGINFYATKSVAYNVTSNGTAAPTTTPKLATTITTTTGIPCQLVLGLALGFGLGIQCVIICIVVVIFKRKRYHYAYYRGQELGQGIGFTFQAGWIIFVSIKDAISGIPMASPFVFGVTGIATTATIIGIIFGLVVTDVSGTTSCKLELGLGLCLGSGIPCLIAGIIAVIFRYYSVPLFKGIPERVQLGIGILRGLICASVIGIIVMRLMYYKRKLESTCKKPKEPYEIEYCV